MVLILRFQRVIFLCYIDQMTLALCYFSGADKEMCPSTLSWSFCHFGETEQQFFHIYSWEVCLMTNFGLMQADSCPRNLAFLLLRLYWSSFVWTPQIGVTFIMYSLICEWQSEQGTCLQVKLPLWSTSGEPSFHSLPLAQPSTSASVLMNRDTEHLLLRFVLGIVDSGLVFFFGGGVKLWC